MAEKEDVFLIEGMTCASCALTIEKAVNKLDNVDNAVVNLTTEKMTVDYQGGEATEEAIKKAAEDEAAREARAAAIKAKMEENKKRK